MLTHTELHTIHAIADRAVALYQRLDLLDDKSARFARAGIAHEVMVVHSEIVPLRLDEMLAADDGNFAHDIGGIHRHLDHGKRNEKARLTGCFLPRFANVEVA